MAEKKGRGRSYECRACDAGFCDGRCIMKDVMYSMDFAVCGDMYIGETDRPVRVRFARHYRDSKAMDVRTAWGSHYVDNGI